MKKLLLLSIFNSLLCSAYCQTLFTYGEQQVSAIEFLNAYNKNKTGAADEAKSLRDYLDLYIRFKLKVQAAKDIRLDTLPALQADLKQFRGQVEETYLKNDKTVDALVNEAFLRSQKDIHVVHFFVPFNEPGTADSVKSYQAINKVGLQLRTNKNNFKEFLANVNKEGVLVQESDLGFITIFTLPYQYENIIYGLKTGESSAPYRTKNGLHIFKNIEERPAAGKVKLAQILFAVPMGSNDESSAKKLADSVYRELKKGADFEKLAKEYSDDRTTYLNGGVMPVFGTSTYPGIFEKMAFSLDEDGEISKPFKTDFGYHIIKRISATPIPSTKDDGTFIYNLRQVILKDSRVNIAKQKFVASILPQIGFKENEVNEADLWRVCDTSLLGQRNITSGTVNERTILFSYNNNAKVSVGEWIQFLRNSNKTGYEQLHNTYKTQFADFVAAMAMKNYRNRLEDFNSRFKDQLDEFKEGNMLFEIMERKIWGSASSDSTQLYRFYLQHKENYFWNASATAVIFSCSNESMTKKIIEDLEKGKSWEEVTRDNPSQVQGDSERYELNQIPVAKRTKFTEGLITAPVINKDDGTVVFVQILQLYPPQEVRNFKDARGLVMNDYQKFLEEKWIEQLKKQYPIKVNTKVLESILEKILEK